MSAADSPIEDLRPVDVTPARSSTEAAGSVLAFCMLVFIDLTVRIRGFSRFHELMREWPIVRKRQRSPETINKITSAVDRAATYYFKRAWCLQRSATTVGLLRLSGIDAQMVIGVKKMPFYAHAWAEVDGQVVNDHPAVQQMYTVLERC